MEGGTIHITKHVLNLEAEIKRLKAKDPQQEFKLGLLASTERIAKEMRSIRWSLEESMAGPHEKLCKQVSLSQGFT